MNEYEHHIWVVAIQELLDTSGSFRELRLEDLNLRIKPMNRPLDYWYE